MGFLAQADIHSKFSQDSTNTRTLSW